jgi:galactokinase
VIPAAPGRQATSLFQERFGSGPSLLVSAPGRVNLIGEHLDYNGGPVLPFAIERRTAVAAGHGEGWVAVSTLDGAVVRVDPDRPREGHWTVYLAGVLRVLRPLGLAPRGARLAVASAVPAGAGLSSSAALGVALVRALTGLAGRRVPAETLADLAWRAEHDEVGVSCGRMDQTISALARAGHALLFETDSGRLTHLPLPGRVWVLETGVARQLTGGLLNQRRRECEETLRLCREQGSRAETLAEVTLDELPGLVRALPPPWNRRLRHVVSETARTRAAAHALSLRDLTEMGRLLLEGHRSLQGDYQSTCPEADFLVASAVRHGAWGARLTGAGWGGAVLALVSPEREARFAALVQEEFEQEFGRAPAIWSTRAGGGVRSERRRGIDD